MPYPFISIKCESKILLHEKTPQQFLWGFLVSIICLEGLIFQQICLLIQPKQYLCHNSEKECVTIVRFS
jgi:hypothetical protein